MWRTQAKLVACVVGVLCTRTAAAQDDLTVDLVSPVLAGQGAPALVITARRGIREARLTLTGDAGQRVSLRARGVEAGGSHRFELPSEPGVVAYRGELRATFGDGGDGQMPLSFSTEVLAPLELTVPADRLDVAAGRLQVQLSRAARRCHYLVDFDGHSPVRGAQRFGGEPAGTWLTVSWPKPSPDAITLRVTLTCHDDQGTHRGVELYPWRLEVPHEEVLFSTDGWDIRPSESGKLDQALHDIRTAVRRYGSVIAIKLFVSGHTDTVGNAEHNQELSRKRARSIASYFSREGIALPIYYAGFGEQELLLQTPDGVDEARNRRARYVLAVDTPSGGAWRALK